MPPTTPGQLQPEWPATAPRAAQGPGHPNPSAPPASAARQPAAPSKKPVPAKRKRRWLRDPLSILLICIIVAALVIAGLIGGELYARHVADTKVAQAVACEVQDQATASFGVAPLLLWQLATQHFTNISVSTAGNQIRDAKGMKIDINIKDVRLRSTSTSKGTIGSLDATIAWTADGIKQSVQNGIPLLGPFVTNSVTTHPSDGTIELKGMLDDITAKPVVSGTGLQLQIVSFNALGLTMPKETVQSTLDDFTSNLTKNYPLGIHADNVEVTSTGVTSHFSTQNANIPTGDDGQDPCFAHI
jgi:LmeA-like phospholipid-binding